MHIPTCRETSALLSQTQDRKLTLFERVGLRLHLVVCTGCRQLERQLAFMRSAVKRYLERDDHPPR
ncbi:MAG: hypothetical protein A2W68_01255 [Betaproteobacteria bacterium RIFCSPLOWO2_02_64_14]|jgi:hypothetical protein|nr:MAG: hypothetical protein A2W68_01255 [Betaproteobacteria bacterium RIFCSPLOWO2_02_64_14]